MVHRIFFSRGIDERASWKARNLYYIDININIDTYYYELLKKYESF
jgi:hypothetical protein